MLIQILRPAGVDWTRVAPRAKAAFTNYLGTSIVMTTIFYGYGLGLIIRSVAPACGSSCSGPGR
jgi:uncharacterized protein